MSGQNIYKVGIVESQISNRWHSQEYFNGSGMPKKDKKKVTIATRLLNLEESFFEERNEYYKSGLSKLQQDLSSTHNETNELYLEQLRNAQERRDYELTRLRLWEEYQVQLVEKQTREELESINGQFDDVVKVLKDRLYDKLVKKIKLLKEDKVLKDLANLNHYSIDVDLISDETRRHKTMAGGAGLLGHSFGAGQHAGGIGSGVGSVNGNGSLVPSIVTTDAAASGYSDNNSNMFARRNRRPRNVESSYNTDSNISGNDSSMPGYLSSSGKRRRIQTERAAASSNSKHSSSPSNDESNFFSDNSALSELLFGKSVRSNDSKTSRAKSKQFSGVSELKPEEVSEDLQIFETLV